MVTQTDRDMEVALRQAVKRGLQELNRAINGDAKTEPQTVSDVTPAHAPALPSHAAAASGSCAWLCVRAARAAPLAGARSNHDLDM
jgi:hypothetical protein